MIYLLDTSGLVRLLSDPSLQSAWYDAIDAESIASCYPQRAEFLYSARHAPDLKEQSVRDALGYTAPVGSQDDEDDEDTVTA
ncbi:PIN domain-containing protein [Streptomyces laurentii]|uniref:hypothetical protein n=1 Tax=Streptomyces laurentii TaxID=39478 RepID=UPI00367AF83D